MNEIGAEVDAEKERRPKIVRKMFFKAGKAEGVDVVAM